MSKVLLGMSGGVDSSTSALVLQRGGHEVVGVTLCFHDLPSDREGQESARGAAEKLGIEHHVVDVSQHFAEVVQRNFIEEYTAGNTPNPCTLCNREVKFPELIRLADEFGCDKIATGHYARVEQHADGVGLLPYQLYRGLDRSKDQSYMLYGLSQEILARTIFPLGDEAKALVRKMAMRAGLMMVPIDDESQDICFIEGDDYAAWLEQEGGLVPTPGDVVDMMHGTVIAQHAGLHHYTIGQRKGLNIGGGTGDPLYVIAKDVLGNRLLVGPDNLTLSEMCMVRDLRWTSIEPLTEKRSCKVKIRYRSNAVPAQVLPLADGRAAITFNEGVRGLAPGQSAVFYSDDLVLGGGVIVA